jgi:acyl-CoA synthetase (NDP forming)
MQDLRDIFEPKEVVLVGSTSIREKVGMTSPYLFKNVTYNMRRFFHGNTCVLDIDQPDKSNNNTKSGKPYRLAVVMLPPNTSLKQSEKLAKHGVKAFVMITGGYNDHQRQCLVALKHKFGLQILGPNTIMGVINTANGLNTTFEKGTMPKKGKVAVVSQSGGVGACLLDWACYYGIGMSKFVFVGDKIDVDDVDLLRYLGKDDQTEVICLYMEGVKSGREFIEEAKKVTLHKPILALKGGVAEESVHRAKSHTASIAGSDQIFDAAFKKAGIIRVASIEELMNGAIALSKQPPMEGDNVAIVSNVGGPAILAADCVLRHNLKLARFSDGVKAKIESTYTGVDASNPIDLIADARTERYGKVLDLVLKDKNVDGVLVINMLKSTFFKPEDAKIIPTVAAKHMRKPVVDVPAGGEDFEKIHRIIGSSRVPLYNLPEKAAVALKILREYGRIRQKR